METTLAISKEQCTASPLMTYMNLLFNRFCAYVLSFFFFFCLYIIDYNVLCHLGCVALTGAFEVWDFLLLTELEIDVILVS